MEGFCHGEGGHRRRKVVVLWLVRGEDWASGVGDVDSRGIAVGVSASYDDDSTSTWGRTGARDVEL